FLSASSSAACWADNFLAASSSPKVLLCVSVETHPDPMTTMEASRYACTIKDRREKYLCCVISSSSCTRVGGYDGSVSSKVGAVSKYHWMGEGNMDLSVILQ